MGQNKISEGNMEGKFSIASRRETPLYIPIPVEPTAKPESELQRPVRGGHARPDVAQAVAPRGVHLFHLHGQTT